MSGTLISLFDTGPKWRPGTPTPWIPAAAAAATLATTAVAWAAAAWAAEEPLEELLSLLAEITVGKTEGFLASGSPNKAILGM